VVTERPSFKVFEPLGWVEKHYVNGEFAYRYYFDERRGWESSDSDDSEEQ
jgi:hypothetical protein